MNEAELLSFVKSGQLDEHSAIDVLRNPYCTAEAAVVIASRRELLASHTVRELLSGVRDMPFARAMDLIATLPWTSLLALAQSPRTPPVVRRHTEKKLTAHLESMALGEKVALARRVHRPLLRTLIARADLHVLAALLDNPRLTEDDVLLMVNTAAASPEFFVQVARHPRWGQCYGVRQALAVCRRAPLTVALAALVQLRSRDISDIASRPDVTVAVRDAARGLKEKEDRGLRGVVRSTVDDSRGQAPPGS
jgi:hypothetical protein